MRYLTALAIVVALTAPAEALIMIRNPHVTRPTAIGVLGTLGLDDVRGLGLQLTREFGGGWPYLRSKHIAYEVDVRARFVGAGPDGARVDTVPIDLIGRASLIRFREFETTSRLIRTPRPWVPYAGLGASFVIPRGEAVANYGVLAVAGVQLWATQHLAVFAEAEVRATFRGGADGAFGGNGGLLYAF